jgi:beta-aspartyl-dipeptidase (metallo-type)
MTSSLILQNGEVYLPEKVGTKDILSIYGKITRIGEVDRSALDKLGIDSEVIDAKDAYVVPGIIDPHEHLVGGDGEGGFECRSPVIQVPEIVTAGITTVVGCLGTDNVTYHTNTLLSQVRALVEEGISAYLWVGGYSIPPSTITRDIRSDVMLIPEVLGAGEIAVADLRGTQPRVEEIARLVSDCFIGGMLSHKCGVTHFHMGDEKDKLKLIFEVMEKFNVDKSKLFPTHIGRNPDLLKEACKLTKMGVNVNMDTVEEDLVEQLKQFEKHGGDYNYLSLCSDAALTAPANLYNEFVRVQKELKWPLEKILPLLTTNISKVLMLPKKGSLRIGNDADFLVLEKDTLEIRHVIANGKVFVKDGKFIHEMKLLEKSNRHMEMHGKKKKR